MARLAPGLRTDGPPGSGDVCLAGPDGQAFLSFEAPLISGPEPPALAARWLRSSEPKCLGARSANDSNDDDDGRLHHDNGADGGGKRGRPQIACREEIEPAMP